jgi:hypothetical protein
VRGGADCPRLAPWPAITIALADSQNAAWPVCCFG